MTARGHVLALCGGVGGAKLAAGLAAVLAPGDLSIVVNTGDDFAHLGLHVSPDIDTVLYTLAGLADRERGWGRAGESWAFMDALKGLGGPDWFNLGDRDLAVHVLRSHALARGQSLSEVTAALAAALGIAHPVIPMSDAPVRTRLDTAAGLLDFQDYFVRLRCEPPVRAIRYDGADSAAPSPSFAALLARTDLRCVVLCPSNPYLSIAPLLALPGVAPALRALPVPVIAVSPIIGGKALKGPAAKLMAELGAEPGSAGVAGYYGDLIDALVLDRSDAAEAAAVEALGPAAPLAATVMHSDADRARLAREVLALADALAATMAGALASDDANALG